MKFNLILLYLSIMIVYHGSSTLKSDTPPDHIVVTPSRKLAEVFGSQIFIYELEIAQILQLQKHIHMVNSHVKRKYFEIDPDTGLHPVFKLTAHPESNIALREVATEYGFKGVMMSIGRHHRSIEIWDLSCLTLLRVEDNLDFQGLID